MKQEQKGIAVDASDLYEVRMVVLMETAPQSNVYEQVAFTQEHFVAVSKAVSDGFKCTCGKNDNDHSQLVTEDDITVSLPDHVKSHYPPEAQESP